MLEPDTLVSLIGALRPPSGHRLDFAVGTTYSLKLDALLLPPAAFALFEAKAGDHEGRAEADSQTPVGLLESVRRHADRILMFCQAGQIAVPERRTLMPFLERSVIPVAAPRHGLFHPKIWVLRYEDTATRSKRYRVLCTSRNLTFDRSRDTIVRLDSSDDTADGVDLGVDLVNFVAALGHLPRSLAAHDQGRLESLSAELRDVRFQAPPGVDAARFIALGLDGSAAWPFPDGCDNMLVISPYLGTGGLLNRLPVTARRSVLVSRAAEIDRSAPALQRFREVYALDSEVVSQPSTVDNNPRPAGDPAEPEVGLHAKAYLFDLGDRARFLTGSANATKAAFATNVEAMIELEGPTSKMGVDTILAQPPKGEIGLIDLLVPYHPDGTLAPSADEADLDRLRRAFGSVAFEAEIIRERSEYRMLCKSLTPVPDLPPDTELTIWPLTTESLRAQPQLADGVLRAEFRFRDSTEITGFLVLEMSDGEVRTQTVVAARLIGDPPGRRGQLIIKLLGDADRFLHYLLLILADDKIDPFEIVEASEEAEATGARAHGEWETGPRGIPLLETMLRAVHDDPSRLDHVEGLLKDLEAVPDQDSLLPPGFWEVWDPIRAVAKEAR